MSPWVWVWLALLCLLLVEGLFVLALVGLKGRLNDPLAFQYLMSLYYLTKTLLMLVAIVVVITYGKGSQIWP